MPDAYSSFLDPVGTSFMTAELDLCTMPNTYSSFLSLVGIFGKHKKADLIFVPFFGTKMEVRF